MCCQQTVSLFGLAGQANSLPKVQLKLNRPRSQDVSITKVTLGMQTIGRSPDTGPTRVVTTRLVSLVVPRVYLIFRNQLFSDAIQPILDKQLEIDDPISCLREV